MEFQHEANGYARQQVDAVLARLSEQYKQMYEQYNALSAQNGVLNNEVTNLRFANEQLDAAMRGKQHENEQLSQRLGALEASSRQAPAASTQQTAAGATELAYRELWGMAVHYAMDIILAARKEADQILQQAKDDQETIQNLPFQSYLSPQGTRPGRQ